MKLFKYIFIIGTVLFFNNNMKAQCDPDLIEIFKNQDKKDEVYLTNFNGLVKNEDSVTYSMVLKEKYNYRFYIYQSDKFDGSGKVILSNKGSIVANKEISIANDNFIDVYCNKTEVYKLTFIKEAGEALCAAAVLTYLGNLKKDETARDLFVDPEREIFFIVDEMPLFSNGGGGCDDAFRQWIVSNMTYPAEAKEKEIRGKVYVQFVVNRNGYVQDVAVIRGVDPILDEYAKQLIEKSPQWYKPGYQKGTPVNVQFVVSVVFKL